MPRNYPSATRLDDDGWVSAWRGRRGDGVGVVRLGDDGSACARRAAVAPARAARHAVASASLGEHPARLPHVGGVRATARRSG
jgi:hypothetical protein